MGIVTCPKCGTKNRIKINVDPQLQPKCGKCGTILDRRAATDGHEPSQPIHVTDANFEQTLAAAGSGPLLIDCWAPWCGPCRIVGPIIDELARDSKGRYRVGKLNVDENPQTAARFRISSIPTMLIFRNGELVDRLIGVQPKQALAARLANV